MACGRSGRYWTAARMVCGRDDERSDHWRPAVVVVRVAVSAVWLVSLGMAAWGDEVESRPSKSDRTTELSSGSVTSTAAADADGTKPLRLSMDFQDANLKDVLKTFSQQTGINVIANSEVGDQAVTLYLEDVSPLDALDQILRASNLTYERPLGSEIYIVKPKTDATSKTITRVYRLKYARVSQSILARAAATFGSRTPYEAAASLSSSGTSSSSNSRGTTTSGSTGGSTTSGGGGGFSGGGGAGAGGQQGTVGIDKVIEGLLTDQGSVVVDGRTNSLVVTDVPENFPRVEAALAALDIRTPQVLVDAEVIETSLAKLKDFGIKWGTGTQGDVFQLVPATRTTRFPFSTFFGDKTGSATTITNLGSLNVGTLGTSAALAVLEALETDSDTKILARPKILTLDNESAIIRLTSDEAIGFESGSQQTTGTVTSTPERTTTGVVLVVTPQVNEGGQITMLVEPAVTKTVTSNVSPPSGQAKPRDPKTRSVRTLVRIHSGDTLVVGGLIDRSESQTVRSVPILSGVPVLGEAFKHNEVNNSTSELIAFVTPRILDEVSSARVASLSSPMTPREQEPSGSRQEMIEGTLNTLERQHSH